MYDLFLKDKDCDLVTVTKCVSKGADATTQSDNLQGSCPLKVVFCAGKPDEAAKLLQYVMCIADMALFGTVCWNQMTAEMWDCLISRNAMRSERMLLWSKIISNAIRCGKLCSL